MLLGKCCAGHASASARPSHRSTGQLVHAADPIYTHSYGSAMKATANGKCRDQERRSTHSTRAHTGVRSSLAWTSSSRVNVMLQHWHTCRSLSLLAKLPVQHLVTMVYCSYRSMSRPHLFLHSCGMETAHVIFAGLISSHWRILFALARRTSGFARAPCEIADRQL